MCFQDGFIVQLFFFFFKQKTAYEMRISDWSSDVCSSDLADRLEDSFPQEISERLPAHARHDLGEQRIGAVIVAPVRAGREIDAVQRGEHPQVDVRGGRDRKSVGRERVCQYV